MQRFDAVVIGAGPGGSMAARELASRGAKVLLLERARLPRVKLCAGWITPPTLSAAGLDPARYPGILQPFAGLALFGRDPDRPLLTRYDGPASYGIVRSELDEHLARRAQAMGAELRDGIAVKALRSIAPQDGPGGRSPLYGVALSDGTEVRAPLLIGAGGQFCPVARWLGAAPPQEQIIVCLERELRLSEAALRRATPFYGMPEFYAEPDFRGYAWYVTKGPFLNVGIGRLRRSEGGEDGAELRRAAARFLKNLTRLGRLRDIELPPLQGHAYKLWDSAPRRLSGPGALLVGDAGGFAQNYSAEGIRPAIETGVLAARLGHEALSAGDCAEERLARYRAEAEARYGPQREGLAGLVARIVPPRLQVLLLDALLRSGWTRQKLVVEGLFRFRPEAHD
jgi:menaquinone-9 beta-reductase